MARKADTVLFIPGFLCDHRVWAHQVESVSNDYNTLVIDIRNCKNLDEMLSQIKSPTSESFHLVGFSMGGYVAQVFAAKNPQKIKSLTMVCSNVGKLSEKIKKERLGMEKVLLKSHYKGMSPKELSYYLHPESLKKEEVTDTILSMSAGFTSEMYINQMKATLDRIDFSATIDTFNYSVMIIGAQNDKVVPVSVLTDLHHRIKRSQLHVIDQSGHYLPLERPDDLSDLIKNFL